MLLQPVTLTDANPRYLLNGFPKAGLHLLALMVAPVCEPPTDTLWDKPHWWGVLFNMWTTRWRSPQSMRGQFWKLARLQPGQYLRAHAPWRQDVADFIDNVGIAHVFIRRDLRDVAVSLAHHVLSNDPEMKHTSKALFALMDSFDEVLLAMIDGVGPYAGVVERWQQYAPWMQQERVLNLRFEDVVIKRQDAARDVLLYGVNRINDALELDWRIDPARFDEAAETMTAYSYQTRKSPTFRKGTTGAWREAFKPQHKAAFEQAGGMEALDAMGYEGAW